MLMRTSRVNQVLEDKVRRSLRGLLRPPWRLSVAARDGRVQLRGPLLPEDLARVLDIVAHVEGVAHVEHHLAATAVSKMTRGAPTRP